MTVRHAKHNPDMNSLPLLPSSSLLYYCVHYLQSLINWIQSLARHHLMMLARRLFLHICEILSHCELWFHCQLIFNEIMKLIMVPIYFVSLSMTPKHQVFNHSCESTCSIILILLILIKWSMRLRFFYIIAFNCAKLWGFLVFLMKIILNALLSYYGVEMIHLTNLIDWEQFQNWFVNFISPIS